MKLNFVGDCSLEELVTCCGSYGYLIFLSEYDSRLCRSLASAMLPNTHYVILRLFSPICNLMTLCSDVAFLCEVTLACSFYFSFLHAKYVLVCVIFLFSLLVQFVPFLLTCTKYQCLKFLESFWCVILNFVSYFIITGLCLRPSDVYVCLHVLFIVQSRNANVLFVDTKTNKLCQLADDMLVRFYCCFTVILG